MKRTVLSIRSSASGVARCWLSGVMNDAHGLGGHRTLQRNDEIITSHVNQREFALVLARQLEVVVSQVAEQQIRAEHLHNLDQLSHVSMINH